MVMFNNFDKANVRYKSLQSENAESYKAMSKDRLEKIIKKKFNTSIIGAIASIEKYLGYLWGMDANRPLTKDEEKFKELWAELRNEVLTKGNNQLRAALLEISEYTVNWNKKEYKFGPTDNAEESSFNSRYNK